MPFEPHTFSMKQRDFLNNISIINYLRGSDGCQYDFKFRGQIKVNILGT